MKKQISLIKKCEFCGSNASCLCFKCLEYFCESCFKCIHDKELKSQHKKEEIDPYVPIDLKCLEHPNNPNNLFCLEEKDKLFFYIFIYYRILLLLLLL